MAIIQNWKIRSRSRKCHQTGVEFEEGDPVYTCIFDDPEGEGYLRRDYSEAGWLAAAEEGMEPFSQWKTDFELPEEQPERTGRMDQDDAEVLLQQLMEDDDPAKEKTLYILVVMMERKKLLKQVGERQSEERRLLIYEHARTGEVVIVTDPQIKLEEIGVVQEEVTAMLDSMTIPVDDDDVE